MKNVVAIMLVIPSIGCGDVSPSRGSLPPRVSDAFLNKQEECEHRPPIERSKFYAALDNGPSSQTPDKPTVWRPGKTFLGNTCFVANAGPVYYIGDGDKKLARYSIDVEHVLIDPSSLNKLSYLVLFSREIAVNELPADFDRIEIGDIVTYDAATRRVQFKIGHNCHEYQLPAL